MLPLSYAVWLFISYLTLNFIVKSTLSYVRQAKFAKKHGCMPPQNRATGGDPIMGLSFLLETIRRAKKSEYMQCTLERFLQFGNTYVNKRVMYETINTIDPENVKEIVATSFNDFVMPTIRVRAMMPLFGDGIFVIDGEKWAHFRGVLRPIFTHKSMKPLLTMTERHFQRLLRHLPADGKTVDLRELFYDFTLDTATEFIFGGSTNTLDPEHSSDAEARFADDYLACCRQAVKVLQMGPLHWLSVLSKLTFNNKIDQARDRAWAYVDRYVDEALKLQQIAKRDVEPAHDAKEEEYNFLRELAIDTQDRNVIRSQLLNVLLASRDTTAALLGNLFFMLARHPEAYAKLREEVKLHVGEGLPTEAQFKNMTWLRWCINESLRIHPVIPANTRQAARDVALPVGGGPDGKSPMLVRKGTCVLMNLYAMHRREDVFGPDTEAFRPERWDGLRPGYAYLPFNGGPRICLGQQFALTEASYVIVRMVQCFSAIEARDDMPYTEYYTIALFSKNGVKVGLTPSTAVA